MEAGNNAAPDWDNVVNFVVNPGLGLDALRFFVEGPDLRLVLLGQPFWRGLPDVFLAGGCICGDQALVAGFPSRPVFLNFFFRPFGRARDVRFFVSLVMKHF